MPGRNTHARPAGRPVPADRRRCPRAARRSPARARRDRADGPRVERDDGIGAAARSGATRMSARNRLARLSALQRLGPSIAGSSASATASDPSVSASAASTGLNARLGHPGDRVAQHRPAHTLGRKQRELLSDHAAQRVADDHDGAEAVVVERSCSRATVTGSSIASEAPKPGTSTTTRVHPGAAARSDPRTA